VDAAYALMVRTYAGIPGKNLLEAVDLANESFGIEKKSEPVVEGTTSADLAAFDMMKMGKR